jgi:hypothetical protein
VIRRFARSRNTIPAVNQSPENVAMSFVGVGASGETPCTKTFAIRSQF